MSPICRVALLLVPLLTLGGCSPEQAANPVAGEKALDTFAGTSGEGVRLYQEKCAECHEGGVFRAPHVVTFQMMQPEAILAAMDGIMAQQAETLTQDQRRDLAEFLSGQKVGTTSDAAPVKMCADTDSTFDFDAPRRSAAWGTDLANTRFVSAEDAGLSPEDVPGLQLKWAFAFPNATRARSQPTVGGGAIFVGSQDGTVYALDEATGCARWTMQANAEIRSAITLETWDGADARPSLYFGDFDAEVYRLDALTGDLLWSHDVGEHRDASITGSPKLHDGILYVPVSSQEWAAAADPGYECCTFRGNVVAMDAATGEILWRSHVILQEPVDSGRTNSADTPIWNPAGAPVWNSPTIDEKRNRLYVGTGESYTSPAASTSDSIVAMDLKTGEIVWHYQGTAGDAWNLACTLADKASCPAQNGPDFDFGAPPVLTTLDDGTDVLLAGQKSGMVHAIRAEDGKLIWKKRIGLGGFAGGVHWGMAADGTTLFAPNADTDFFGKWQGERKPGLYSMDAANGNVNWFTPAPDKCPEGTRPQCDSGLSAAPTAMPGVIFAGGFDGILRAYDAADGKIIWEVNTVKDYITVNGDIGKGGSIESDGPVIANGKVIINSGYLYGGRMGGNVMLVYSPDGQ